ncbi:SOS response-associated peptidase [Nocardiopsis salina]|uniref:SOS response-associated peptidase n=1 Tax=Nocardiopsis salina TaxID=245836 RepID=UPI00034DDB5A|nr:SOS response-associated peptidase [Nocardiopsis salina]
MCGRYAQSRNVHQLQLAFGLPEQGEQTDPRSWPPLEEIGADYNISPGSAVHAVLGPPPQGAQDGASGPRSLHTMRWGLVPSWAKDRNIGYKMINARAETIAEKPAFRAAFRHRRCLLPADAYYEWQLIGRDGRAEASTSPVTDSEHKKRKARSAKKPYAVRYQQDRPLALAGIFERWRDPEAADDDPAAWLWTVAVVTTAAVPGLDFIHERMPVVLPEEDWAAWLDPGTGPAELAHVMGDTPVDRFSVDQVSAQVNSVKNNDPSLLEPVAHEGDGTETLF